LGFRMKAACFETGQNCKLSVVLTCRVVDVQGKKNAIIFVQYKQQGSTRL